MKTKSANYLWRKSDGPLIGMLICVCLQNTVNCYPLTNTATIALTQPAFRHVLTLPSRDPLVVDFETLAG